LIGFAALLSLALAGFAYAGLHAAAPGIAPAARGTAHARPGLLELPLAAQGPVSASLGADSAAYRVRPGADGLLASNPAQHLRGAFTSSGLTVTDGGARVGMSVRALGYGSSLSTLPPVPPHAAGNRVEYSRAGLREWYANGPLGIEQGFTVARAPGTPASGPLTIAIGLTGVAHATVIEGGRAVALGGTHGASLNYAGLAASDAGGRALRSRIALDGSELRLVVDTRGARFPVRVDPFIRPGMKLPGANSVAISRDGSTILLGGAGGEKARVFVRSGETWSEQALLDASPIEGSTSAALSADGNTALLGNEADETSRGGALVFVRSGSTWSQQGGVLRGAEQVGQAKFGDGVALSGDGSTALIGARGDKENEGSGYVFTRSGETWTQQGPRLAGNEETSLGQLGTSVALSADGDTALLGGWGDASWAGAAWVFTRSGESWTEQGPKLTGSEEESEETLASRGGYFGVSAALSEDGNTALLGGWGDAKGRGAAWAFTRSGETWTQQGPKIVALGEQTDEKAPGRFGESVSLSSDGNTALIDGPGDDKNFGAVWVFKREGSSWSMFGGKFGGPVRFADNAGVALSGDAQTAMMGVRVLENEEFTPEPPEITRCAKLLGNEGSYSTAACDIQKAAGTYELSRGFVKGGFSTKLTEGAAVLETSKGVKVTCKTQSSSGSYAGHKQVSGVTITFTGCESGVEVCSSAGAATGEIVTNALEGVYGVEKLGATQTTNKLALDLFPVGGSGPFMEFACGTSAFTVRGSVLLPVFANKMESTSKFKYLAIKGKQKPERFLGGPLDVLEASINGGAYAQTGLTSKITQSDEEKVEINSVF
jgi:hypothetical protein